MGPVVDVFEDHDLALPFGKGVERPAEPAPQLESLPGHLGMIRALLRWVQAVLTVIRCSQVDKAASPLKLGRAFHALINVSWATSAAR
jgi:hypothetical protein